MLNKIKDKIKLYLKFFKIKQIRFKNYADYREYLLMKTKIQLGIHQPFLKSLKTI